MVKKIILAAIISLGFLYPGFCGAQVADVSAEEVIQQMYDRYEDSWYDYLTFKQETIFYKEGEVDHSQQWFEALSVPGQLVIKFDSLNSGSGLIFKQDSQFVFQQNELVQKAPRVHDLLVLGFDVYGQPPAETVTKLKNRGFDFSKTYETEWQGRPVYVIGASGTDDNSNQFWIDKERLYFVRLLRVNNQDGTMQETQFNNYEKVGGGWVSPVVLFYSDGQLKVKESYTDIEAPEELNAAIFDLEDFERAVW